MTHYQKAFLLRLVDSQIDKLMDEAETEMIACSINIAKPESWDNFWESNPSLSERYSELYAARGQIQVMEVEQ